MRVSKRSASTEIWYRGFRAPSQGGVGFGMYPEMQHAGTKPPESQSLRSELLGTSVGVSPSLLRRALYRANPSNYCVRRDAYGVELCDDLRCELKFGCVKIFAQVSPSGRSRDEQDVG
jgi:hypothetical protein